MAAKPRGNGLLQSLQVARALAAGGVAAFNVSVMMSESRYGGRGIFSAYTGRGNLGIDFFFVLSGFIILFAYSDQIEKPGAWRDYLKRRFVRLYPVYWLYTGVFVALLAVIGGTGATLPSGALNWLETITLVRFSEEDPPLAVAWSQVHQIAFYAMFLVLMINRRLGIAGFALWALTCIVLFHQLLEGSPTPWFVYTAAVNLWFFFGMGACLLYWRLASGWWAAAVGLAILALAAPLNLDHRLWPVLLVTGFALAIAGIAKLEDARWFSCPRWLVYMGNASYTIYLTHESLAGVLLKIAMKTGAYDRLGGEAIYLMVLPATFALGCLVYAMVERPLVRSLSGGGWRPQDQARSSEGGLGQRADAPAAYKSR
jgi:peptidoglycan/LPS O-acetylase OafA/YrhL